MQNKAIEMVGKNALTFIKGPPGCGKTKTIARLCKLLLEKDQRVILGAVSNTGNISIMRQLLTEITCYNNHSEIEELMRHVEFGSMGI
jgi:Ni2+-binding GTPase involved in maturation of urease and hydrogenase